MNYFWRILKPRLMSAMVPAEAGGGADYPSKPIRILVPFTKDGPADKMGRTIGAALSKVWGQPVIVDDEPGTNGIEGTAAVAKAAPDGYTLLLAASAHYINPAIYRNMPFDTIKDFAPISLVVAGPNVLVVHPSVPVNNVAEFIAYAKAHPGQLKYASGGIASPSHLAGELFKMMAGVDMVHVPYQGHVPSGAALLEGRDVQLFFDAGMMAMEKIKSGKLRILGVTSTHRLRTLPDIPTIAEAGLPGFEVSPAMGVLAPAGTPPAIVNKLSEEIAKIMHAPDLKSSLQNSGAEPVGNTPAQFAAYVKSEVDKWAKVVDKAGIQPLEFLVSGKSKSGSV